MKALEILFSSFLLLFFLGPTGACLNNCSADGDKIRFPFHIISGPSTVRCGYRGFGLTCKGSQPVLKLPSAGDFIVQSISYARQRIWIGDPDHCIPKRLLNFNLSGSPFQEARKKIFRLLSCLMDNSSVLLKESQYWSDACVNETNYAIVAVESSEYVEYLEYYRRQCQEIKTVSVSPYRILSRQDHRGSLELGWDEPNCKACEQDKGTCGFKKDGSDIGCSKASSHGLPRSAKYGLIIGIGIPGLLCLIGLSCFTCGLIRTFVRRRRLDDDDFSISIGLPPAVVATGLDGRTIDSYPKTVLGESCRLPQPNDSTCSICLSEYQPQDTIRTIPECNHCFHANCLDEWLKMNATCPLCRNSPDRSSSETECSSGGLSSIAFVSSPASPSSTSSTSLS